MLCYQELLESIILFSFSDKGYLFSSLFFNSKTRKYTGRRIVAMVNLEHKVAIVTGSSRGIGRGCAIEMAKVGADVVVTYRTHPEEAQETAEIIRQMDRKSLVV